MPERTAWLVLCLSVCSAVLMPALVRAGDVSAENDVIVRAIEDELARSMKELALEDLPRPYFIHYGAQDRHWFSMWADYGGLLGFNENLARVINSSVRVGSYELDNTNFQGSYGGRGGLPLDDDYASLRHSVWRVTDWDYKRAVEVLARKQAFLKEKTVVDRPDDFSAAQLVTVLEPRVQVELDRELWERKLKLLSARFGQYPEIQDSQVNMFYAGVNRWAVNSEGARLRTGDTGAYINIEADTQAPDGMYLVNSRSYVGKNLDQLPAVEKMLSDIDEMCANLISLMQAPVLEHYDGPVLFEAGAAGKVFDALLADSLCARPIPVGSGGWADESLEKKIGRRVLPRSFHVVDDPGPEWFEDSILAGSYEYDDEAVRASRVSLVENGILKTLLASRSPTKKIKGTTGHGRSVGYGGGVSAQIGCLYISDDKGMTSNELKQALIQAARDEGIEYGLRIASIEEGGGGMLGDPVLAYKVYVEDGREELVRGLEFLPVETRALKHILAAGVERKVYNSTGGIATSIISPAVLFEELELTKSEVELDKLPILKAPATRGISD